MVRVHFAARKVHTCELAHGDEVRLGRHDVGLQLLPVLGRGVLLTPLQHVERLVWTTLRQALRTSWRHNRRHTQRSQREKILIFAARLRERATTRRHWLRLMLLWEMARPNAAGWCMPGGRPRCMQAAHWESESRRCVASQAHLADRKA